MWHRKNIFGIHIVASNANASGAWLMMIQDSIIVHSYSLRGKVVIGCRILAGSSDVDLLAI